MMNDDILFDRPKCCPDCGRFNPAGRKLPDECWFCRKKDGKTILEEIIYGKNGPEKNS